MIVLIFEIKDKQSGINKFVSLVARYLPLINFK